MTSINKIINAIQKVNKVKLVAVRFKGSSKVYHYKTWYDSHLPDTYLVVNTPSNGMTICKVCEEAIEAGEISMDVQWKYKWIVSMVPTSSWEQMNEWDQRIADDVQKDQDTAVMKKTLKGVKKATLKKHNVVIK